MLGLEPLKRVLPACKKWHWLAVGGSFFSRLCACHFARDFLRGSSSRIALDPCESEVDLIVYRERPRQTAAWKKPGHLEMGAPSAIDQDSEPGFRAFGGEFFPEEHRRERDGKIPPRLRFAPLGGSQPPWARSWAACPAGRRIVPSEGFEDCASRFARPGSQNQPSEVRPA
jgi:hypothetical protein